MPNLPVKRILACSLVALLLLVGPAGIMPVPTARAANQVVINTADSGPGSLRQAIADVHDGGTISFNLGSHDATITLTDGQLVIGKNLTIAGPGADKLTISGNGNTRVFNIVDGDVTVSGVTISQGWARSPAWGAGIYNTGRLTIRDCTISHNSASGGSYGYWGEIAYGGGIYNAAGTVTIEDSALGNNAAVAGDGLQGGPALGGGIHNEATLVIRRSTFSGNVARGGYGVKSWPGFGAGGGLSNGPSGTVTIEDSTLCANTAIAGWNPDSGGEAYGGGIANQGEMVVWRSVLCDNTAWGGDGDWAGGYAYGGGIDNAGTLTVESSIFSGNRASGGEAWDSNGGDARGGGLANSSTLTVVNSTLSGNTAQGGSSTDGPRGQSRGGGIYANSAASTKLSFCTIARNLADDEGGGLYSGTTDDDAGPIMRNTIVGENTAPTGPDICQNVQSRGYNLIEDASGGTLDVAGNGNTAEGNIVGEEPRLGPLQDNGGPPAVSGSPIETHALLDSVDPSPAIDAGSSTDVDGNVVATDQRGFPRPYPPGGDPDIGAHERGAVDVAIIKDVAPGGASPGESITYTLAFRNASDMIATGVVISDRLPLSVTITSIISSGVTITDTNADPTYVWEVENLLPGQGGAITLTGELSASLSMGAFTNTATIATAAEDGYPGNNSSSAKFNIIMRFYLPVIARE